MNVRKVGAFGCVLSFSIMLSPALVQGAIPTTEREALIALYNSTGGDNWFNNENWQNSPGVFNEAGTECHWYGVQCDDGETSVLGIALFQNHLTGTIPAELGSLASLGSLVLRGNQLTGPIPPVLGTLANLYEIFLDSNQLTGSIPPELGNLDLWALVLNDNQLTGTIPIELCNLSNLQGLILGYNQLTGTIPPDVGNLTSLNALSLEYNQLTGSVPPEVGNLADLQWLTLEGNQLTGPIPPELGNLSKLEMLYLFENQLTGTIPAELGNLTNLENLDLSTNQLVGSIPAELGSLSRLRALNLYTNNLTGDIPTELTNLRSLQTLYLANNQLTGSIPGEVSNLANLVQLVINYNQLTGSVPPEVGNLANLQWLNLGVNQLTGPIPVELSNLVSLWNLDLDNNQLVGEIPAELANLANLQSLGLGNNQLTGPIPPELGNLANLQALTLKDNQLTGSIPPELGNLSNLYELILDGNELRGAIPPELGNLSNLLFLDLRHNHLLTDDNALREFLNSRQEGGDWESSQSLDRYFAQFADGGGLFSQVVLFNLNDVAPATGQMEVLGSSGEELNVDLNGETVVGTKDLTVPPTGLLSLRTDGLGDIQTGSVRVTTDRHVEGVVIFGGGTGLAGVGSSPEFESGFVAPMERNERLGINTGIAVTVLSDEEADLDLTLLDTSGNTLARAAETLAAQGHKALFVTEIPWDAPVDFSGFSGTLVVTSSQPVTGTVLQTRPGEFVTLPVAPLQEVPGEGPSVSEHRLYFAQFANGAGALSSQILLFNLSDEASATAQITLRDNAGAPLTVDLGGEEVAGETQVQLGPKALRVLATDGLGDLQVGSVLVASDQPLAGVIVFIGAAVGSAGVGSSVELPEGFVAPMETDEANGINTGIAVMNLDAEPATLDAHLLGSDGQRLASASVELEERGHAALFVTDFEWDPPVDFSRFEGLLRVRAEGRTAATAIQTRPGQFATMPVTPKPIN